MNVARYLWTAKSSGCLNSLLGNISGLLADNSSIIVALGTCFMSGKYRTRRNQRRFRNTSDLGPDWVGRNTKLNQYVISAQCGKWGERCILNVAVRFQVKA